MARWWGLLIVGLACFAPGVDGQSKTAQSISGTWVVVSAERQMDPFPEREGATVTFDEKDKTFRFERTGGLTPWFGEFRIDYGTKRIDLVHKAKIFLLPTYDSVWEGVFKFDGDTLVIIHAEGHDARPTEFLTGYDLTMMTLRRK